MNEGLNADAAKPHVSKTGIALLLVGLLMLLAWVLLPWIHQPERGPTLARIISAERSANEFDIQRQGLSLPPIAALVTMGLALWGMFSPQHSRALALVTLIAGLLGPSTTSLSSSRWGREAQSCCHRWAAASG